MALDNKKCRLCRRERAKLFLKGERCFTKCPLEKKGAVPPGVHGLRSSVRLSDYGNQLRGKQRIKRFYGVSERQLKNYYLRAIKMGGDVNQNLISLLEARLDNVVYRVGLAPSRRTARQLVSHGHLKVNGQKVTVPSYLTKAKDRLELSAKAGGLNHIKNWLDKKDVEVPSWLERKGLVAQIKSSPEREDWPSDLNPNLVVEYYSR